MGSKEADENKIKQLQQKNEKLEQKIRRLSTVDLEINQIGKEQENENEMGETNGNEMKQFMEWSRKLSWPDIINTIYTETENNDNHFLLMQRVLMEQKNINKQLKEDGERKHERDSIQIQQLKKEINDIRTNSEKLRTEYLKDKEKLAVNTMNEFNRLRSEIKEVGLAQQQRMSNNTNNNNSSSSYYSYLSGASSFLWSNKK